MFYSKTFRLLTFMGFVYLSKGQTCLKLDHNESVCITDTQATVTCPDGYWVHIKSATAHWQAQSSVCPPAEGIKGCEKLDATSHMRDSCMPNNVIKAVCRYTVLPPTRSICGDKGVDFIDVVYRCVPTYGSAAAEPIYLGSPRSYDLTQAAIDGKALGLLLLVSKHNNEEYELRESDKSCHISIPANSEIELDPHILKQYKPADTTGPCDQKFVIWDVPTGSVVKEFCLGDPGEKVILECSSEPRELRTQYTTVNPDQGVVLQFVVRVADQQTFHIDCSHTFVKPTGPTTPTPSIETTTSSTTTNSENSVTSSVMETDTEATYAEEEEEEEKEKEINWKLFTLLICIAVALLLLIMAVLIMLISYKRDSDKAEEFSERTSNKSSGLSYVSEVYVDGNQRNRLVMDKSVSSGEKISNQNMRSGEPHQLQ